MSRADKPMFRSLLCIALLLVSQLAFAQGKSVLEVKGSLVREVALADRGAYAALTGSWRISRHQRN